MVTFSRLFFVCSCFLLSLTQPLLATPVSDVRTIDGTGNNLLNPTWGAAHTAQPRVGDTYYPGDGSGSTFLGGPGDTSLLPNPREISNMLYDAHGRNLVNDRRLSNMVWQWGQFLDHDITLVETSTHPGDFAPIITSNSDPMAPMIPFTRSEYAVGTGTSSSNPRQQVNSLTSYIDASNVYGSDYSRAMDLRDLGNGGRMKVSAGNLLPFDVNGSDPTMFLAGDDRANEQVGLISMHTLFVREHNRLAGLLSYDNPTWSDEQLYQTARKIVGAQMQAITYNEFLPALLGRKNTRELHSYNYDYDDSINASVGNEFAASIYRFGHSMLPEEIKMARVRGAKADSISLKDAFFNPDFIASDATDTKHMDQLLLGLSTSKAQEIDAKIVEGVRSFLFGDPGSGGMDLAALNIQRGRDHGIASYNDIRLSFGLSPADSFRDITRDRNVRKQLKSLYGSPDKVDAWVGALAEDHIRGGSVGELVYTVMMEQFTDLRDGDRYFYTGDLELMDNDAIASVIDLHDVSLSDIISWNTSLSYVPNDVFRVRHFGGFDDYFGRFKRHFDRHRGYFDRFGFERFGFSFPSSSAISSIPEPSSSILVICTCLALVRLRQRTAA